MTIWAIAFIASTALAAIGFVVVAVLWLKKLRETLALALGETAGQQIRTAQRLSESLAHIQRQQSLYEQRIQSLTDAHMQLQREIGYLADKVESNELKHSPITQQRVLH